MDETKFGLSEAVYTKIKDIVIRYPAYKFKLFGSRSRGNYKPSSDIDIAIFGELKNEDKYAILNDIDLLDIPYTVDIVFVNEITKEELLESITKEGVDF